MSEFCNFDGTSHFVGPSSKLLRPNAVHTSARSEDMCFFRHAPSLKGWVPSEKSRGCCSTMRAPWLRTGCIFCSTSDAALALPIPPKVRSQNAAHTLARSEDMCFFRHAPSLKGWVPSEKSRGCC